MDLTSMGASGAMIILVIIVAKVITRVIDTYVMSPQTRRLLRRFYPIMPFVIAVLLNVARSLAVEDWTGFFSDSVYQGALAVALYDTIKISVFNQGGRK